MAKKKAKVVELVVAEGPDFKIIYDRETRDYRVEWRGRPVGYRASRMEAMRLVEQLSYDALTHD